MNKAIPIILASLVMNSPTVPRWKLIGASSIEDIALEMTLVRVPNRLSHAKANNLRRTIAL
jgi:hypothetical protein